LFSPEPGTAAKSGGPTALIEPAARLAVGSGLNDESEYTMCLGIPGRVDEVYREHDVLMGRVDFGGVFKRVCLEYVDNVQPGEYVLVHVGFGLARLDEAEANRVFELLHELDELGELQADSE
jgi:hydrogenase expression/formation protein HypC